MSQRHPLTVTLRAGFALLTLAAVAVQLAEVIDGDRSVINFFSYFTIEANIFAAAVLLVAAWFGLRGKDVDRLAMVRGASTLYMVVTGIVYFLLLRDVDVQTSESWVNTVLHYVMPVVLLLDWSLLPPRGRIGPKRASAWLAFPLVYALYCLVRGAFADWYPYPFIDAAERGYPAVLLSAIILFVMASILVAGLLWIANRRSVTTTARGRT